MSSLHFFKVKTRLGMAYLPFKGDELNVGVEEGAGAVLNDGLLGKLPRLEIDAYTFSLPESLTSQSFYPVLSREMVELKELILRQLRPGQKQITVGGDHSLSLATILSVLSRITNPACMGYIQFDSHPDMLDERSSSTKNFHGMYLRPLVKTKQGVDFDIPEVSRLISKQLLPENMLLIGNLDAEIEELRFMAEQGIRNIARQEIKANPDQVLKQIKEFISRFDYLHLNFDVDVFDQSLVSATGCPSPNGLLEEEVFPILSVIATHPNLSLDLVEVNPKRPSAVETIKLARQVISVVFG